MSKLLTSSDFDAYKHPGRQTTSIVASGSNAAGQEVQFASEILTLDQPDFGIVLFDNSDTHSGKYRNLALEFGVDLRGTVSGTPNVTAGAFLMMEIEDNTVQFILRAFNPYALSITYNTTTYNIIYVPYEATL